MKNINYLPTFVLIINLMIFMFVVIKCDAQSQKPPAIIGVIDGNNGTSIGNIPAKTFRDSVPIGPQNHEWVSYSTSSAVKDDKDDYYITVKPNGWIELGKPPKLPPVISLVEISHDSIFYTPAGGEKTLLGIYSKDSWTYSRLIVKLTYYGVDYDAYEREEAWIRERSKGYKK